MREIKFRGKRLDNSEWVYGAVCVGEYKTFIQVRESVWQPLERAYADHWFPYEVDPATVGQFTGLEDKNGVDLYEGDVCLVKEFDNEYDDGKTHVVKYFLVDSYPAFDFDPCYDEDSNGIQSAIMGSSVQVIGTIHDESAK